ncbi:MAG: hypothetical protein GX089_17595 [Fibrobacter sp.]|jgi:hypothetical protein|nr:hypothetical protein [Fibrobacter sp.]HON09591.1 hypothetical protein [Chitinispirillaceae bacterium]
MKILNFLIWVLPFLVLVCAYFGFRSKAHRKIRYLVYAIVVFIAFLFDLMGISFKADQFDSVLKLMVLFIVSEVCWNFLRLKNRIAASAHIAGSFIVFFLAYSGWVYSGPSGAQAIWKADVAGSYLSGKTMYVVKERKMVRLGEKKRIFELHKVKNNLPLESEINTWEVPESYALAEFSFGWSTTPEGVNVDLISGGDTLWTLVEDDPME